MNDDYKKTFLSKSRSIMEAIKIIDLSALQIVLVVDDDNKLLGTVTDGDVRRAILDGVSLDSSIEKVMNTTPRTITAAASRDEKLAFMTEHKIHQLPIIDENNCIIGLAQMDSLAKKAIIPRKNHDDINVVLMLGGLGSRLLPLTQDLPKPMIKIGGKPLLETIINNFSEQGFKKFYFSVNYKSDIIKDHFGDGSKFGVEISYLHEYKRMGTAGALSLLPSRPTAPIIVMNGDILTNSNFSHLATFHRQNKSSATMCVREYQQQVPYGVVKTIGTKLNYIVEKPSNTYFVNAGIYVVDADVLDYVPDDQYFDMPDLFNELEKHGKDSAVFPIREYWLDIGNLGDLERGRTEFYKVFPKDTI